MSEKNRIINWDNVFAQSESFKNSKPFHHAYVNGVFNEDFYKKLYETYPKKDDSWKVGRDYRRYAIYRDFLPGDGTKEVTYDENLSPEWNELKKESLGKVTFASGMKIR